MTEATQRAKWKRARELVGEAGDMDPGDASIMFVIAAVYSQRKYYDKVVRDTLDGKAIEGLESIQDLAMFRLLRSALGPKFEEAKEGFINSEMFKNEVERVLTYELIDIVKRMVIAVKLHDVLDERGVEL